MEMMGISLIVWIQFLSFVQIYEKNPNLRGIIKERVKKISIRYDPTKSTQDKVDEVYMNLS